MYFDSEFSFNPEFNLKDGKKYKVVASDSVVYSAQETLSLEIFSVDSQVIEPYRCFGEAPTINHPVQTEPSVTSIESHLVIEDIEDIEDVEYVEDNRDGSGSISFLSLILFSMILFRRNFITKMQTDFESCHLL